MGWRATGAILTLFAWYVVCDVRYAAVWQDRLSLALYEAERAPAKPRVLTALTLALLEQHRFADAALVLDAEAALINDPKIPAWDRADAAQAVTTNRQVLSRMLHR